MIHGQRVRLHRNTVCHLEAPGRDFDGELCQVQSYDAAKNKWHIELNGGRHKGKELLVPESSLRKAPFTTDDGYRRQLCRPRSRVCCRWRPAR